MTLFVPESVRKAQADAEMNTFVDIALLRECRIAKDITKELKGIDPYLEVVYINRPPDWNDAVDGSPPGGIQFNRWHVKRHNPGTQDTYYAYTTPGGGYREPDSGMIELVRRMDLGDARVKREILDQRIKDAEARQKMRDVKDEEFKEELQQRIAFYAGNRSYWMGSKRANVRGFSSVRSDA